MHPHTQAYFYAMASALCFASASLIFAHFARRFSSVWMNFFKAVVCFAAMSLMLALTETWQTLPRAATAALFISGILGLGIGDIFLMKAYARMGAGRTLILFGFQPLFLGVASFYLFGQDFSWYRLVAILFFVACLFLFSLEKYKEHGHWEIVGLVAALIGVLFDNTGVLLTRWSFELAPLMSPLQANVVRCAGSVAFFVLLSPFFKAGLVRNFVSLTARQRMLVVLAALTGTFASLLLYVNALKIGHLASLAAIGVFGPLFSTSLECVWARRWPSRYLWLSLLSFGIGFALLLSL